MAHVKIIDDFNLNRTHVECDKRLYCIYKTTWTEVPDIYIDNFPSETYVFSEDKDHIRERIPKEEKSVIKAQVKKVLKKKTTKKSVDEEKSVERSTEDEPEEKTVKEIEKTPEKKTSLMSKLVGFGKNK